jgi:hypothetical protein
MSKFKHLELKGNHIFYGKLAIFGDTVIVFYSNYFKCASVQVIRCGYVVVDISVRASKNYVDDFLQRNPKYSRND